MDTSIRPVLVTAEFDEHFMKYYEQLRSGGAVTLYSNPKIFMHNPRVPCNPAWLPEDSLEEGHALSLQAKIKDAGFLRSDRSDTDHLVVVLDVDEGNQPAASGNRFYPYAAIMEDPHRGRHARRYARALITALLEYPRLVTIQVFRMPVNQDTHSLIEALDWTYADVRTLTQD